MRVILHLKMGTDLLSNKKYFGFTLGSGEIFNSLNLVNFVFIHITNIK